MISLCNGLQLERKRDLDGRISHIQLTNDTAQLTNDTAANDALYHGQYDFNGNVIAIHEQGDTQHYRYDALNRLISSDNKHHRLSYEYDSVGNRRQRQQNKNHQEAEKGAQEHYHYAEHSNRLLSVRNLFNNTERKLDYDALGNIIRDQRSSKTLSLSYNAANRLEQVDIALNEQERSLGISHKTAYYRYNASGQRVSKWVWQQHESGRQGLDHSASRHFHYNPHQQLIAETDHQGKAIKAYIYAGETRVALLDYRHNPQGELYFIHNDHLGTPKLITNSTQEIVWRNTSSAFGQVQTAQADNQTSQLEQNLSFPGQYRDAETGFSYNYFRDYDPSLGRYIQSDPIGLEGGVNTYGYVMGNPVRLVDPLGLVGCPSREELGKTKEVLKQVPKMFNDYLDDNTLAISRGWKMLSTTAAVTAVVIATPFAVAMATIASGIDVLLAYNESIQAGHLKFGSFSHSLMNSTMAQKALNSTRAGAAASLATDQMQNYFTNKDNFRDAGK